MALITHQTPGFTAFAAGEKLCLIRVKFNRCISSHLVGRSDKLSSLKHYSNFRNKPYILNQKPFKISSFKGNGQTDDASEMDISSKPIRKSVSPSCVPEEREETLTSSSDLTSNTSVSTKGDSKPAENLFNKWPISRHSRNLNVSVDKINDDKSSSEEKSTSAYKGALLWFMGLDATVKIPLLIFVPWYFISRVVYGLEVTKELMPLWVIGPLITALYIKLIKGICFLYVFTFKLAIKVLENVPSYSMMTYRFVMDGRLQSYVYSCICRPIVDLKNMDYKELGRQKLKQIRIWAVESYLDYVESIWPYYCRMIRFLKRANLL